MGKLSKSAAVESCSDNSQEASTKSTDWRENSNDPSNSSCIINPNSGNYKEETPIGNLVKETISSVDEGRALIIFTDNI